MNVFYCKPSDINGVIAELGKDETHHATKVLRYGEGDSIVFTDGEGGWFEGTIIRLLKESAVIEISNQKSISPYRPRLILAMGILKKRNRMEFAVEKATELGVSEICFFRSENTVKENVRLDRLKATALAAMKQSLRAWLPKVKLFSSLEELLDNYRDSHCFAAHEKVEVEFEFPLTEDYDSLLLMVGPEGGFSDKEISDILKKDGELISLGDYRLRAETAAVFFISRFVW